MRAKVRLCLLLAAGGALLGVASARSSQSEPVAKPVRGGTFRIALPVSPLGVDTIDPALTAGPAEELILRPTCAQLMAFPGPRPEVSDGYPKVSRDRLTYSFTIRKGFRFNTGEPLSARNFAHAITRVLSPTMKIDYASTLAERFVGGREFLEGKEQTLRGVVARGRTLTLRLTKPQPQLLHDLAQPGIFCPVPATLPLDPEGVGAPLPGSGPYYISKFTPRREVVLVRNPRYRGPRAQHVDRFVVDLTSTISTTMEQVLDGRADFAFPTGPAYEDLARRYGVNRSQFFVHPAFAGSPVMIILNSSRPLFRNNPALRRAVSYAIDRLEMRAVVGRLANTPTDQFLPRAAAGFRDARIYPLRGDMKRARALARGRTRSGKAIYYVSELFPTMRAQAALVQEKLRELGIEAEIQTFPHPVYLRKVNKAGEPFDIASPIGWATGYPDHTLLNWIFHSQRIPPAEGGNFFHFRSPRFDRLLDRAERLAGTARFQAYGRLDLELARDAAPGVALWQFNTGVLVSRRAGCHRFNRPLFDLASVCLTSR